MAGPEEGAFSGDLRAAVERGTTHANAVSVLRDHLADRPIADLLRRPAGSAARTRRKYCRGSVTAGLTTSRQFCPDRVLSAWEVCGAACHLLILRPAGILMV